MPASLQNTSEPLHALNVARLFIDFDSISAGNTNVFDRGAIDRQIEMVAWEVQFQKIALSKFDTSVLPTEVLPLKVVGDDVEAAVCCEEAQISLLAAKFYGLACTVWHLCA